MYKHISFLLLFLAAHGLMAQLNCVTPDASIWKDTWASCEPKPNPNMANGSSHWIQYDFGTVRTLSKTWIWNTNDPSKLNQGFKKVQVDYSQDGRTWTSWGEMDFPRGPGTAIYGGFSGPDLVGIEARYVLLTAVSNHGDSGCSGLAEVKFNLLPTVHDDSSTTACLNVQAVTEIFIEEVGETYAILEWEDPGNLPPVYGFEYRLPGGEWILVPTYGDPVAYLTELSPGTTYDYRVAALCGNSARYSEVRQFTTEGLTTDNDSLNEEEGIVSLYPNPARNQIVLEYANLRRGDISLSIMNLQGQVLEEDERMIQTGVNRISILLNDIPQGIYLLEVIHEESGERAVSKFIKL